MLRVEVCALRCARVKTQKRMVWVGKRGVKGRLRGVCGLCEVSFLHMALPRRGCANVPLNRAVSG